MWRRRRAMDGLDDDIRDHLEREVSEQVGRGMSPEEARRQALISFGNVTLVKEDIRAVWVRVWLDDFLRDVRYALRTLARNPVFAAAVVVTLGLGVGGTTAVFSVVDALFVRAPPGVSDPESLRRLFVRRDAGSMSSPDGSAGIWSDAQNLRATSRAFAGVAAYQVPQLIDLGQGETASRVRASVVSGEFFNVLGIRPAFGRLFLPEEDGIPGAHPVAVISHAAWESRFGGTGDAIGRTLLINGRPLQVVGVTQRGFHGIETEAVDLWLPAAIASYVGLEREDGWRSSLTLSAGTRHVVRLRSVDEGERATAEASAALAQLATTQGILDPTPEAVLKPIVLASLSGSSWVADLSVWLLMAAVIVLVISTANVANLLLARDVSRRREFAMRLSLGAGALRIVRQQLTESIALALLGGAAALVVAYCGVALLRQFPLPPGAGRIDARLLGFSLALSLLTALVFGLLPAWRSIQVDPVRVLKGSQVSSGLPSNPIRLTLVVLQVSLSFALLVGAALFVRSLEQVSTIRGGADLDRLLTVEVTLRADEPSRLSRSYAEFLHLASSRLASVSGVSRSATVFFPPFYGWGWSVNWRLPGDKEYRVGTTYLNVIDPNYFEAAGTRLLQGRTILPSDQPGTEPVAVVNEALARLLAKDVNPVGQCLDVRAPGLVRVPCLRIIGVAESQRNSYLDPEPVPTVFRAVAQLPQGIPYHSPMLLVRTTVDAAGRAAAVQAALQGLRADLPYVTVAPLRERLHELRPFQLGATLFTLFAVLALMLSSVGLYAVLGYFVAERTSEIGVRRALGASAVAVMRLIVWHSLVPVGTGLAIGFIAALIGTRGLAAYLYGVVPQDPLALASAACCLIAVAALATVLPVCRALRIDPIVALRRD